MAFRIRYSPLCTVNLLHGFHLSQGDEFFDELSNEQQKEKLREYARGDYRLLDDLSLIVPPATQRILSGLGCLVQTTKTGFRIATQVADPAAARGEGGPVIPERKPVDGFRLVFALSVRQPLFWNYSNSALDQGALGPADYFLTNQVGKHGGEFPNLTMPLRPFEAGNAYQAGDLVSAVTDDDPPVKRCYLAVRAGQHPRPDEADGKWKKLENRNYLSDEDKVFLVTSVFVYPLPGGVVLSSAVLVAEDGSEHPLPLGAAAEADSGQAPHELVVDARELPSARYRLRLRGLGSDSAPFERIEPLYIDDELASGRVLALIELVHQPGDEGLGDFRLYDDEAKDFALKQPEFVVRLLNRHTFWRFHFPKEPDAAELGDLQELNKDQRLYITKQAMPLTKGFQEVKFGQGGNTLLPNPTVDLIVPEKISDDQAVPALKINRIDRVYSDIHLHIQPK